MRRKTPPCQLLAGSLSLSPGLRVAELEVASDAGHLGWRPFQRAPALPRLRHSGIPERGLCRKQGCSLTSSQVPATNGAMAVSVNLYYVNQGKESRFLTSHHGSALPAAAPITVVLCKHPLTPAARIHADWRHAKVVLHSDRRHAIQLSAAHAQQRSELPKMQWWTSTA